LYLELGRLDSVEHVAAHPHNPAVVVTSRTPLTEAVLEAVLADAGYEIAGR
jgi:hypothetical protein